MRMQRFRRIAKKEALAMIASGRPDPEFADAVVALRAYVTESGSTIADYGGFYREFSMDQRFEALKLRSEIEEAGKGKPVVSFISDGYQIDGTFDSRLDEWCRVLQSECGVELDYSDAEKRHIELYVSHRKKKFLQPGLFEALVAYAARCESQVSGEAVVVDGGPGRGYGVRVGQVHMLSGVFEWLAENAPFRFSSPRRSGVAQ
jgi:hypothetical protein